MTVECFLDTNILIYAALGRETEEAKRKAANELISSAKFGLSAQVMQEFYAVSTRKTDQPLTPAEALEWIENLEDFPCVSMDTSLVKRGAEISVRYRISPWDGTIIAAAELLGAKTLYTEDLSHGQSYGGVRVHNPFKQSPLIGFHEDAADFEGQARSSHNS